MLPAQHRAVASNAGSQSFAGTPPGWHHSLLHAGNRTALRLAAGRNGRKVQPLAAQNGVSTAASGNKRALAGDGLLVGRIEACAPGRVRPLGRESLVAPMRRYWPGTLGGGSKQRDQRLEQAGQYREVQRQTDALLLRGGDLNRQLLAADRLDAPLKENSLICLRDERGASRRFHRISSPDANSRGCGGAWPA